MYSSTIIINNQTWYRSIYENKNHNEDATSNHTPESKNTISKSQYDTVVTKSEANKKSSNRTLFSDYPRHVAVAKFITNLVRIDGVRLFTVFDDYLQFSIYQKALRSELRSF